VNGSPLILQNQIHIPAALPTPWYQQNIWFTPLFAVLLSVWVAHKLTQRRDWEKVIGDDLQKIETQLDRACEAACASWTLASGAQREASIAATIWRIQLIGQQLNLIERRSSHNRWASKQLWIFPWRKTFKISVAAEMVAFRQAITNDPFNDPAREANDQEIVNVEYAKGVLITALNRNWQQWIMPR
jgi:hypothetical protein